MVSLLRWGRFNGRLSCASIPHVHSETSACKTDPRFLQIVATIRRKIRQFSDVPIVMVTARVEEIDRLPGLEPGADDYICKPFSPREALD